MSDAYGSSGTSSRTRPLTWAVVVCVVVYNAYLLIRSVHSELWGWMIPILVVWFSIPVAAVYAFKRLHLFMTGDRDLQHSAFDQIARAVVIGGLIHLIGMTMRPEKPPTLAQVNVKEQRADNVVTPEDPASPQRLAQYVSRCGLTQDQHMLVLLASDGGLHLMNLDSGELVSLPPGAGESFDMLVSEARWSNSSSSVVYEADQVGLGHEKRRMQLGPLGLQYIGPTSSPHHFIAFNPSKSAFQRLNASTGDVIWTHPVEVSEQVSPAKFVHELNPNLSWNLVKLGADNHKPRYLLLVDDPVILKAAGLDTADAKRPHAVFLDPLMPTTFSRILELVQVPGTPRFLMRVGDGDNENLVRFTLQPSVGELGISKGPMVPLRTHLIQSRLGYYEFALGANTAWQPLDPPGQALPASGFSVAWGSDLLASSPAESQLALRRPGQGYLPRIADFGDRSFSRDRTCVASSIHRAILAIALGPNVRVLSKALANDVETILQKQIDLPIDAKAAMDASATR